METLTFRSSYSYSGSTGGIEVPIVLSLGPAHSVRLLAKVDTGAEFCIFQREYAENLGIDVEAGEPRRFNTAAGGFDAYGHTLTISCLEWEVEAVVYFATQPEFPRNGYGTSVLH